MPMASSVYKTDVLFRLIKRLIT